ncbi:MAG: hypothetical protein HY725_19340 [Candidatus Rokubacteria bacterium]|nr:hypothetical protein [Candidatus Rokubacteria bacterium]
MKALVIWFAALGVLLSFLGLLVGAQERRAARTVDPVIYTEALEPELPTVSETQPDILQSLPALTF